MFNVNTSSFCLAAVLAACLAPTVVSAAEADLSPPNGGSGEMPSGYSQLNFFVGDGYWAPELRLPATPSAGDRVMADTTATYASRFKLDDTAFAAAGAIPFSNPETLRWSWNAEAGQWDLQPGRSARVLTGTNVAEARVPNSHHALTQYTLSDGAHVGKLHLPALASDQALLTVANRATWAATVYSASLPQKDQKCLGKQDCTFRYDGATRVWQKVEKRSTVQPNEQLPFPIATPASVVTRVVDVHPLHMTLPALAVHGDVYSFLHTHPYDIYRVMPANTSLSAPLVLPIGEEVRFRFNRLLSRWEKIN